jgi:hypothetical protein
MALMAVMFFTNSTALRSVVCLIAVATMMFMMAVKFVMV